jgi:hypothetical protein
MDSGEKWFNGKGASLKIKKCMREAIKMDVTEIISVCKGLIWISIGHGMSL